MLVCINADAKIVESRGVEKVKARIAKLKEEVSNLKSSSREIEEQQKALLRELKDHEREFSRRFERVLVPLLHWPSLASATKASSWLEREHLKFILSQTRQRIISEPLQLISDRELKLSQSESFKSELAATLKSLESKEGLLDLQLEELRQLERQTVKKKVSKTPATESN